MLTKRSHIRVIFKSLRTQLMLYFIGISVIVLTVGSILTYNNMVNLLEERNEELTIQQFSQIDLSLGNLMDDVTRISAVFMLRNDIQEFLKSDSYSYDYKNVEMIRNIQKIADDIILNYPYIDSIYIFKSNGEVTGTSKTNSLIVRGDEKPHPFFSTQMYQRVEYDTTEIKWYGGYKSDFFNEVLKLTEGSDKYLITHVRYARAVSNPNKIGFIVFNINEKYLLSLYGAINDKASNTYITDNTGRIISSNDSGKIGNSSEIYELIDKKDRYGSITLHEGKNQSQLIYYKLSDIDWYILREVPLKIDSYYARSLQTTFLLILFLSIFVIFIVSFFWLKKITEPLNQLSRKMADVGQGHLGLTLKHIPQNELGIVVTRFNEMSVSIADLMEQNKKIEEEKRKLEIETLQAQINPHFIYNTLNMIKWMAMAIKAQNIVNSIVALGNILRPVFKTTDTMHVLKEEIMYIQNYITIINWRYGNKVLFNINADEELLDCRVPRFILQPLVENSITHGYKGEKDTLAINIDITEISGDLVIEVTDNGAGISPDKLEELNQKLSDKRRKLEHSQDHANQSIGILNVNKRIYLSYGEGYGIRIESREKHGTKVTLRIAKTV